jgi:nucleoside-diphosphate-sugar epimerase
MSHTTIPWPVALVGAGWLGRALCHELGRQVGVPPEAGVLATTRSGLWSEGHRPPYVDLAAWNNLEDEPDALREHLAGARSLVVAWSSGGGSLDRRRVFVEGAKKLLEAIDGLGLERVVYVSSTSALPNVDAWLDEDCRAWPLSERGRVQREAEELIAQELSQRETPWVILRMAGLYGPGRELGRLYKRDPGRVFEGDGAAPTNLIHQEDAVAAILAALALDRDTSCIVHGVDDDHCTRREMFTRLAEIEGHAPPQWELELGEGQAVAGKRVGNRRLKRILKLDLRHPVHLPSAP